jgi:hypothetical protein
VRRTTVASRPGLTQPCASPAACWKKRERIRPSGQGSIAGSVDTRRPGRGSNPAASTAIRDLHDTTTPCRGARPTDESGRSSSRSSVNGRAVDAVVVGFRGSDRLWSPTISAPIQPLHSRDLTCEENVAQSEHSERPRTSPRPTATIDMPAQALRVDPASPGTHREYDEGVHPTRTS